MSGSPARETILVAAARLIERDGLDALRMAAVARMSGYGRQTVYYHFRSKADILTAVVERLYENLPPRVIGAGGTGAAGLHHRRTLVTTAVREWLLLDAPARVALVVRDLPWVRDHAARKRAECHQMVQAWLASMAGQLDVEDLLDQVKRQLLTEGIGTSGTPCRGG